METRPEPRPCSTPDCGARLEACEWNGRWVMPDVCEACRDRAFWSAREAEQLEEGRRRRIAGAALPPRHTRYLAGEGQGYVADVHGWLDELAGGRGVYLSGPPGGGKTLRAVAIALDAIEARRVVRYWTEAAFLADLRAGCAKYASPDAAELLRRACTCDLLVLDDLGTVEHRTEAYRDWLHTVVMTRYDEERSTIWTSNVQIEALEAFLSGRARRRIRETCRQVTCRPVQPTNGRPRPRVR